MLFISWICAVTTTILCFEPENIASSSQEIYLEQRSPAGIGMKNNALEVSYIKCVNKWVLKGHISTVFWCINDKIICQNIISRVCAFNYNKNRAVQPYIQHSVQICDLYVIFNLNHLCEHIKKTVWNKISDQRNKFRICTKFKLRIGWIN